MTDVGSDIQVKVSRNFTTELVRLLKTNFIDKDQRNTLVGRLTELHNQIIETGNAEDFKENVINILEQNGIHAKGKNKHFANALTDKITGLHNEIRSNGLAK